MQARKWLSAATIAGILRLLSADTGHENETSAAPLQSPEAPHTETFGDARPTRFAAFTSWVRKLWEIIVEPARPYVTGSEVGLHVSKRRPRVDKRM